jgi:type II secretory pathway pseudopilin PulG
MTRRGAEAGHTLIELLIAMLVMSMLVTGVVLVAIKAQYLGGEVPQRFDQQQRARVALDLMARDIRHAGAGLDVGDQAGPLTTAVPGLWPHRVVGGAFSASTSAFTTMGVVGDGVQSFLSSPLSAGGTTWILARPSWCGTRAACGARVGDDLMVWTTEGRFDLATVDRVAADAVTVRPLVTSGGAYPVGASVAGVVVRTYTFDAGRAQLRLSEAGGAEQPLIDGVRAFSVALSVAGSTGLASAPATSWLDGPWRGSGATLFDADLQRVRLVHLRLVLEATDPRVEPFTVATEVALRNPCPSC